MENARNINRFNDVSEVVLPNDENKEKEKTMENKDLNKIKKLLAVYGAKENEIDNFIKDLQEVKEEIQDLKEDAQEIVNGNFISEEDKKLLGI